MRLVMLADYPLSDTGDLFRPTPVFNLVSALTRCEDLDVHVITFARQGRREVVEADGLTIHVLLTRPPMGMASGFMGRLAAVRPYLRRLRPDIVHGQGTEAGYAWLAVMSGYPHIITVHGFLSEIHAVHRPPALSTLHIGRAIERLTLRRAENAIALSSFSARLIEEMGSARCFRIPNAVSDVFFNNPWFPSSGREVLYVGRISPEKGLAELLLAMRSVEQSVGACRLIVIGRPAGAGSAAYMALCRELAALLVNTSVEFVGILDEESVADHMVAARCLVLPSRVENAPMTVAEAMAVGVPPIASRVGGCPDLIENGISGYLIAPGRTDDLASAISRLLTDPAFASDVGANARKRADSWRSERVAELTVSAYEQVLEVGANARN